MLLMSSWGNMIALAPSADRRTTGSRRAARWKERATRTRQQGFTKRLDVACAPWGLDSATLAESRMNVIELPDAFLTTRPAERVPMIR